MNIGILVITVVDVCGQTAKAKQNQPMVRGGWQASIAVGSLSMDYTEIDQQGSTPNGKFNTETGNVPIVTLELSETQPPLYIGNTTWSPYGLLAVSYASGDTDYDGYLQSGSVFTPYATTTDNEVWHGDLTFGLKRQVSPTLQVAPNATVSHRRWERGLEQYDESFHHTAVLAGMDMTLQPIATSPLMLTVSGQVGKLVDGDITVSEFGLDEDLGNGGIWRVGIDASYPITKTVQGTAGVSHQRLDYEQTNIDNGYQYPSSETKETVWQVGLQKQF